MCYYFDDTPAPLGGQEFPQQYDFQHYAAQAPVPPISEDIPDFLFSLPPSENLELDQDVFLAQLLNDGDFLSNILDEANPASAAIDLMDKLEPISLNPQPMVGQKRKSESLQMDLEPPLKKARVEEEMPSIKPLMIDCKTAKTPEEEEEEEDKKSKRRLVWTPELHERFVWAVEELGGADNASPKTIQVKMNVDGLTLQHIKSHLQKYRQQARKSHKSSKKSDSGSSLSTTPLILYDPSLDKKATPAPQPTPIQQSPSLPVLTPQLSAPQPAPAVTMSPPHMDSMLGQNNSFAENDFMKLMLERSIADMAGRRVNLSADQYNWLYLGFTIGLKTGTDANPIAKSIFGQAAPRANPLMNMAPQSNGGFFDGNMGF